MRRITDRLFIGDLGDCREHPEGMSVVHACRNPCYCDKLGKPVPSAPNYLAHAEGSEIWLNIIDPPTPLFQCDLFERFLDFAKEQHEQGRDVLVHCNKGESRAPSLALLFCAKVLGLIDATSYDNAWDGFEELTGAKYTPGKGIETWLRAHWEKLPNRWIPFIEGAATEQAQVDRPLTPEEERLKETRELTPEECEALVMTDPLLYFSGFVRIRDKSDNLTPEDGYNEPHIAQMKAIEAYLWLTMNDLPVRLILGPKARQVGFSTITAAMMIHHSMRNRVGGMLIADQFKRTELLWKMFNEMVENDRIRELWGVRHEWNADRAVFTYRDDQGNERSFEWLHDTAKDPKAGASGTRSCLWFSEAGRYGKEGKVTDLQVISNASSSVPDVPGTIIVLESTAEGANGVFYNRVQGAVTLEERMAGKIGNGWIKVFCAWHEVPDYRLPRVPQYEEYFQGSLDDEERRGVQLYQWTPEQIAWRRAKLKGQFEGNLNLFNQEFPDSEECVSGRMRVGTSSGIIPLSEVLAGLNCDHGRILRAMEKGVQNVVKVTTDYGYSIIATPDHRIALSDGSFCEAVDCVGKEIQLQPPVFAESQHIVQWGEFAGVKCNLDITEEWAFLLGVFMGDGAFDGQTLSIAFNALDEDCFQKVFVICQNLFGQDAPTWRHPYSGSGCKELRVNRKELRRAFDAMGLLHPVPEGTRGRTARRRRVHVPECIWRSPKNHVRLFLRGLFDADGWIDSRKTKVKFFSKYKDFASDVQFLLLGFGIHSRVRRVVRRHKSGRDHEGFELLIYVADTPRFIDEIGFASSRKQGHADIPLGKRMGKRPVVKNMADTVVSVEEMGEEMVYDLTIDGVPVFGANGVLVHNCAFQSSGTPRFNIDGLARLESLSKTGHDYAELGVLEEQRNGSIFFNKDAEAPWLWLKEGPMFGARYLVSGDYMTGEQSAGSEERDEHAVCVWKAPYIDASGTEQHMKLVAVIFSKHGCRFDEDVIAERTHLISRLYGNCIIVPEVNEAMGVLHALKKLNANIWKRTKEDEASGIVGQKIQIPGWKTTTATKPIAVANLGKLIREQVLDVHYKPMVHQFRVFVQNENGTCSAKPGQHDDLVMSAAIAATTIESATLYSPPEAVTPTAQYQSAVSGVQKGGGALG